MRKWAILLSLVGTLGWIGCSGEQGVSAEDTGAQDELARLPEMKPVKHGWVDSSVKLGSYTAVWIEPVQSTAKVLNTKLMESLKSDFDRAFQATGKKLAHGGLKVSPTVTKIERANMGRAWIPFAGASAMQAGVGMDVLVTDERSGKVVAKFRHFLREGLDEVSTGTAVVDAIIQVMNSH